MLTCKRCSDLWRDTLLWCEDHAGLGGWVGAVGAIVAILAAWGLARSGYLRTQRLEDARVNTEINLVSRTASEFDYSIVQRYLALSKANDPNAAGYYNRHLNDSQMSRMVDFNTMPITQWPSVESIGVEQRRQEYDGTLNSLQKALNAARK
jgi:hypothetical protein